MTFSKIVRNKKQYLPLLLLADEQEDMIDRYLDRGIMYVLEDPDVKAVCVVTQEADGLMEIKNLAVAPEHQRKGCGSAMIRFLCETYPHAAFQVGTGDSPLTVPFYEACGFVRSHVLKDFFTDNYDHPIIEAGILLRDMVILKKPAHHRQH